MFRKSLEKVIKLEEFIKYHSNNYFSGFYDGQWRILAHQSRDQKIESHRKTQESDYIWNVANGALFDTDPAELDRLGPDFSARGFSEGRVEFAVEFDKVIRTTVGSGRDMNKQYTKSNKKDLSQSDQINQFTGNYRRFLSEDSSEKQHVLVPESTTIAQYLNREF